MRRLTGFVFALVVVGVFWTLLAVWLDLAHLRRGRALVIILGANDFDGDMAERYGYVNRALPDSELGVFVDVLARRIARRVLRCARQEYVKQTRDRLTEKPG